jgi:hypothetical protein
LHWRATGKCGSPLRSLFLSPHPALPQPAERS